MKKQVNNKDDARAVADLILGFDIGEYGFCVDILTGTMTTKQRGALHVYCQHLADALNDAGHKVYMEFLGKEIEVEWTMASVKERIWKPVMESLTTETSTEKQKRPAVSQVYDVLNRHFIEKHDVYVPFPEQDRGAYD